MEAGTDKNTRFDKDCQRIENGVITSNDPASKSEITPMSCSAQFATGFTKVITRVQERRSLVVDDAGWSYRLSASIIPARISRSPGPTAARIP